MLYRVEIVQTNVFFIEADTPELAQNIAIEERIWDHNQTGRDNYGVNFYVEPAAE
jgi:hypothetical protein